MRLDSWPLSLSQQDAEAMLRWGTLQDFQQVMRFRGDSCSSPWTSGPGC